VEKLLVINADILEVEASRGDANQLESALRDSSRWAWDAGATKGTDQLYLSAGPSDPLQREVQSSTRRKRLLFRCWHRGTQESDLLLGSFADSCLAALDENQLGRLEALLDCSDPDLFDWILSGSAPPTEHDHDVLRLLRTYWVRRHRIK